jgi:clan AA aspartic protease
MIIGVVKPSREAIVKIEVRGPSRTAIDIEAILDTGFTESLTLPRTLVGTLGLRFVNTDDVTLADGNIIGVDLYEGIVIWDGQEQPVIVHCLEGSPLVGMSLLYHHLLTVEAVDGGPVTINPLP